MIKFSSIIVESGKETSGFARPFDRINYSEGVKKGAFTVWLGVHVEAVRLKSDKGHERLLRYCSTDRTRLREDQLLFTCL
jgi:hypothetical protein